MQSSVVQEILNRVNLDSLRLTVQVLSGEVGSKNGGVTDTIRSRVFGSITHDLAAEFLQTKLENYGLSSRFQSFTDSLIHEQGINVLAEQRGTDVENRKYILCAHYDAISDSGTFAPAPGADDNASGCAAVLETARLLSKYQTSFTIVYALWDHEEVTTYGSTYYARAARSNADSILGVLNLDMLGWDGNSDGLMEIHGSTTGCSKQLADTVAAISRGYQLVLDPTVYIPGTASSDHAVFWRSGFTAILCTEAYWGGDFNPYYHSAGDRLGNFNSSFFHNLARLAAGSIAQLAGVEGSVGVRAQNLVPEVFALEQNYPNPFNPNTVVRYQLPVVSSVRLVVYDVLGREVAVLVNERKEAGVHEVKFSARGGSAFGGDGSNLASGVYVYRLTARHTDGGQVRPLDSAIGRDSKGGAGDFVQSKRLVLLK